MELDKEYWEQRYRNNEMGWDIGYASTPITAYFNQIQNKDAHILIPGAGNAYEAEYLYRMGFDNVFVLDWCELALENLLRRVPGFPPDHLIVGDFFQHEGQYEYIVEQTFFCAIDPSLRKQYAAHTYQLLESTGTLVGVLFNVPLNADRPPFGGNAEEYHSLFSPYFHFHTFEPCHNSIPQRAGSEWFINLKKPYHALN